MSRLDDGLVPLARSLLLPGESLQGCCVATRVKGWSNAPVVIAVTAERLIIQQVNRRLEPNGQPLFLPPEAIASATFGDVAGWGTSATAILVDVASLKLVLRTTTGEKLALTMTPFGGGEVQRQGIQALADWISSHP